MRWTQRTIWFRGSGRRVTRLRVRGNWSPGMWALVAWVLLLLAVIAYVLVAW
jgi:hypothetical protein